MISTELRQHVESAIEFCLARGLKLNIAKWHKVEHVYFKRGSSFFSKDPSALEDNYKISSCCVLGAVMFMSHAQKNDPLPKEERTYLTSGWSHGGRILGQEDTWAIGFTSGWDAIGLDNKTTEVNDFLREIYDTEAYEFGIEMREKSLMATFAKFVSDYLHIKEQMSTELEIPVAVIEKWAAGVANPHPLIKAAVWTYLCKQQMKEHNSTELRDEAVKRVEDVLRKHDPQGLIKMGAPPDEYSSEAEQATYHLFLCRTCQDFNQLYGLSLFVLLILELPAILNTTKRWLKKFGQLKERRNMESYKVKVAKLAELIKPFSFSPPGWFKTPITKNEVEMALFKIDLLDPEKKIKTRQDHVRRIAWYAGYGFGKPIKLKVKSPTEIEVVEGHHQLRAAIVRGDTVISILVDGDLAHLVGILPN